MSPTRSLTGESPKDSMSSRSTLKGSFCDIKFTEIIASFDEITDGIFTDFGYQIRNIKIRASFRSRGLLKGGSHNLQTPFIELN